MRKLIIIFTVLFSVFLSSCGDGFETDGSDLISDEDVFAEDSEINEKDVDEIPDNDETDTSGNINKGLDDSFLEPSQGISLKMVAPILESTPEDRELKEEERPFFLKGEMRDKSGNKIAFSNVDNSFGAKYDDYLYVTASSEYTEHTYYSVSILPSFDTLEWMSDTEIDTINSEYFYLYIYKNDFVNDNFFRVCPYAIPDPGKENYLRLYIEDGSWNFDETFGIMVNSHLTFDKKSVTSFFGDDLHKLCYCYEMDGGSYTQRDCTVKDMDLDPFPPSNPEPADGAENIDTETSFSWNESSDPDGGKVTYTLYFGADSSSLEKMFENSEQTSWTPPESLSLNNRYFWQILVTDDDGNSVEGDIWTFNTDKSEITLSEHDFLIVVNEKLEGKIDDALELYMNDIKDEGYSPALRYWYPGGAEYLKSIIKKSYEEYSIRGAVFAGDMPPAFFEMESDFGEETGSIYESFPSEYYFMDMDGIWEDTDDNGMFDKYPENLTLEIFTSRIMGNADEISDYLEKASDYRNNGSFFKPRNFFSFIDNDWLVYEDESGNVWEDYMGVKNRRWELESIYGNNYERREELETTSKKTYMGFMTNSGAEYVYQWIHSTPQKLYFHDNFSPNPDNILTINEIIEGNLKGSFYNLFDCSISRYTEENGNIAFEYIKGKYGLATLGSTKVGGVFNPEVMNIALSGGENWGTAYQMWVNDIWKNYENYGFDKTFIESWWLGIMIQGDPLLTLTDKKEFLIREHFPKKFYSPEFLKRINSTLK